MDDEQEQIILKIPTAREKLLVNFPNDPKSDIKLVFKSKQFCVSKAYLRLQSGYFKKVFTPTLTNFQIKQNFNQDAFEQVISCFYGAAVQIKRTELGLYYPIIRFLQIQCLFNLLRKDVLNFIEHYDIFVVIKIAHNNSDQQLFQACLQQLEKQQFQQLKYHQFQLLQTDLSLFKLIIKTHNRHRSLGKPGLQYTEINQILSDYCDVKNMGKNAYRELKFQLIDKIVLTAKQYKQIFLDEMKNQPSTLVNDYPTHQSIIVNGNPSGMMKLETANLAQSVIASGNPNNNFSMGLTPQNKNNNSLGFSSINNQYTRSYAQVGQVTNALTIEMQNIFQKKKNQQLVSQNQRLSLSLINLKKITEQNQQVHQQMQKQLFNLKAQLKKKQQQQFQHNRKLSQFPLIITRLQKQIEKRGQDIDKLQKQIQQLKKIKKPVVQQQTEQTSNSIFAQSHFLPALIIQQLMSQANAANTKTKSEQLTTKQQKINDNVNYKTMDQEELQQLYMPRIKFNIQPVSTPKYNLPTLSLFITGTGFSKHVLTLIYRRSITQPPKGKNTDIRDKNNLLILINTLSDQNIGGFVSVPIPKNDVDYIEDNNAFLFTLTKNQKFNIKKSQATQAIFMSQQYLISFANDLMISKDCLKQKSQCSWPSSYQGAKGIKQRGPVWLVSQDQFLIKDLEVYEMNQQEMEMVI